jgi:hypothetical protein
VASKTAASGAVGAVSTLSVLSSTVTTCTSSVASGSKAVRVDPWVGLVHHVRTVRSSGVVVGGRAVSSSVGGTKSGSAMGC